jgi:hypothetical protein
VSLEIQNLILLYDRLYKTMPRRSAKSRAKSAFYKKQMQTETNKEPGKSEIIINDDKNEYNGNSEKHEVIVIPDDDNEDNTDMVRIAYVNHVSGHFNQGDFRFSEESRAKQCACNALVSLCHIPRILPDLSPEHLDQILLDADYLYRTIIQEFYRSKPGDLPESGHLAHDQLPDVCVLQDNSTYAIDYEPIRYCTYEYEEDNDLQPLDVELQEAFYISNSSILIFGSYMMSVYKDCSTGHFVFFDSHCRTEFGFVSKTGEGNSVALIFSSFEKLSSYLKVLCRQLNTTSAILGIQPVQVKLTSFLETTTVASESPNQPGCSSWSTTDSKCASNKLTIGQNRGPSSSRNSKMSKEQKWWKSLSSARQNEILAKKRKRSNERYQIPEYAERKRLRAREASKQSYDKPENAKRKREQSKQSGKQSYQNPEKAERKREQSKQSYQNPEKAERKREQSRQLYNNPENAEKKRQQNRFNKYQKKSNIDIVITNFQKACKEDQLIYTCQVCQRIFFKRQVLALYTNRYNQSILNESLPCHIDIKELPVSKDTIQEKVWICQTCHKNLLDKCVPRLATINNLALVQQPYVLEGLNMLERHLVSPAILFMKMIPLIKGAQKGINGQVVCVKANVNDTAKCLPRLPTDQSLIRVKFKRRLAYEGHHMCQDINPNNIRQALAWLKANNPVFEDIDIDFDAFDSTLDDQLVSNSHDPSRKEHDSEQAYEHPMESTDSDDTEIYDLEEHGSIRMDTDMNNARDANSNEATNPCDRQRDNNTNTSESDTESNPNENGNEEYDITNTSAPLYSFLHPVDFAQYLADRHDDSILCVAPGEGNTPELVLQMEAKCFPVEFPDASNTFNVDREVKLSPSRYFNARIFSADNRFASNPEYIFFALYATEVQQIWDNICIALRRGNTKTIDGKEITSSMLTDTDQVKKLIRRNEGYRFLSKIRGTPAYWETSKKDVFAMLRQLGMPTFFITFSAADRRWVEIDNAILISQGKDPMTLEQHKNMTWEEHCRIIMSNPATAARMFQQRVYTFISDVILSPANPIGKVEDYYYRTEFQQRGWPHIHMIVWIKDAPMLDQDPDEDIATFIDTYISCELPPTDDAELHEIVSNVQMHTKRHTKSCRKTGKVCRFNFPKPPANKTFICRRRAPIPDDLNEDEQKQERANREQEEKDAKLTIGKIWDAIEKEENANFDEILRICQITHAEFENSLGILTKRNTVYLKRRNDECWINNYNPHLIRCWNGNMDIQYVLDPFAAVVYMLSYLTKSEREMGDLLRNAQKEAREGNLDAVSELKKLGSVYLQHREVSVMGAIYLVCSMPLKQSTRNVIFIQTDVDGQKMSLPIRELQKNAENSEDIWKPTQIEKYVARPRTSKYKNMCMAKFFSTHYQVSSKTTAQPQDKAAEETDNEQDNQSDAEHCHDDNSSENRVQKKHSQNKVVIKLKNHSINMKERTRGKPAVIRYPRVSIKRDKERYHMNMLRLYFPHTTTEIKPESYDTYESYHLHGRVTMNGKTVSVQEIVKENMKEFEPDNYSIDQAWEALQEIPDLQDAWNALNPEAEQQNLDERLDRSLMVENCDDVCEEEIPEFQGQQNRHETTPRCAIETCRPEITEEQAESMMRQLNDKQRQVFNYVSKWCNDKARDHTVSPFHIFLTGGAGTGKSHVIRCITYYAKKTFAHMIEDINEVTVLLLAHTGTAAFNIYGETICSALKIPAKPSTDYTPLGEESLNTLRMKYQHLQLVIIDEISMVSTTQLDYVHGRLEQIKGTSGTSYFGNVSILAVGDFYQLPPVCPRTPLCVPRHEILKDIWNTLFEMVELTDIMRQRDDAIFAQMLNRLRTRKRNEPIDDEDKQLLHSRVVSENDDISAPDDALHLFFRNADVNNHNERKITSLNTQTYTIKAIDVDQKDGRVIKVHNTPHRTSRKDDTTLADELKLAVGARVMLISNVDVTDGLCNGVSGIIKGFEFGTKQHMPTVVYVNFDSDRIGMNARTTQCIPEQYSECIPIMPRKESFHLKGQTFTTTREQIPLKLAWAVTIHKVQGQTTDKAVISMKNLQKAMAYVALSRVTHLEGMYLTDFNESRIFCDENVHTHISNMMRSDLSPANPVANIDDSTNFIIVHHNIQSLNRHVEDIKSNAEMKKAHVICLSETWLQNDNILDPYKMIGYTFESVNSGKGRGVAMYIQNSIKYQRVFSANDQSDILVIRTSGNTNLLIGVIYKPVGTNLTEFSSEMNDLTAQFEILDTDHNVFVGDFNHDLLKHPPISAFDHYKQLVKEPTTSKGTLLDHIYIKPEPQQYQSVPMTTHYSYHNPTFIAIKY